MVAVAMIYSPAIILGLSDGGTFNSIVNISSPSTMLSFITVMFTVLLLLPAIITAF